jgi:hypothetical protein
MRKVKDAVIPAKAGFQVLTVVKKNEIGFPPSRE